MGPLNKTKTALLSSFIAGVFIIYVYRILYNYPRNTSKHISVFSDFPSKKFIYLVQVERCLPSYFAQEDVIGNTTNCRCDVLVLSYKNQCHVNVNAKADHIQYINGVNTTWTSGRNKLYHYALQRKVNYLYYIFADDDLRLTYSHYAKKSDMKQPEFRTFENFLVDFEPVMGSVNYEGQHNAATMINIRKHCWNKPDLSYIPMIHFDAIFNAFHRDAVRHLLPYLETHDKESWWDSSRCIAVTIEFKFRGQAVMYPVLTVKNTKHRPYPRDTSNVNKVMQAAIDREIAKLPQSYRNHFAVKSFKENHDRYDFGYGQTSCMDIYPHQRIQPYLHFERLPLTEYKSFNDVFNTTGLDMNTT